MSRAFDLYENREFFDSGDVHSIRRGVYYKPATFLRYGKTDGRVGRVWQISKNSWGWVDYRYRASRNHHLRYTGKATTFDQAIQRVFNTRNYYG